MQGMASLSDVGEAREKLLGLKLDTASQNVSNQSTIDRSGFLTALSSTMDEREGIDISDLKKARLLFKSLINSNPKRARGWIAAARIEEIDGKTQEARNILAQGVEHAPYSEDLWLEAARMEPLERARAILAKGVKFIPKSIRLWLNCAKKETDPAVKIKVLKKALKLIPQSEKIWRELIELSMGEVEAKDYLGNAVKCVPDCLDFWLSYAKLAPYDEARLILNKANDNFKNSERKVWIHAAKLEETNGNPQKCEIVIQRGLKKITKKKIQIRREDWLEEAFLCEKSESNATAKAIIGAIFELDKTEADYEKQWIEDVDHAIARENHACAKSILEIALQNCPQVKEIWYKAIKFEKMFGTQSGLDELLTIAVKHHPDSAEFWMRLARCCIIKNDMDNARAVLLEAQKTCINKESIYLARVHLEKESSKLEEARQIVKEARDLLNSEKTWLESILLERQFSNNNNGLKLAKEAIKSLPESITLHLQLVEILESLNFYSEAKSFLEKVKNSKIGRTDTKVWVRLILLEEKVSGVKKARAVYETAKTKVEADSEMWLQMIRMEQRAGSTATVKYMISAALKECQNNGELWALAIELETKSRRKAKSVDALAKCENDVYVVLSVMKLFWQERKKEKTRSWLERAVHFSPTHGDSWGYYLRFVETFCENDPEERAKLVARCKNAEPNMGRLWKIYSDVPQNWNMPTEEILGKVTELVDEELEKYK
jgi:pre-mRNA-processing factor 6